MSLRNGALIAAGLLCLSGLLLRLAGASWGLDVLLLGMLAALTALFLAQRSMHNTLATTRRALTNRLMEIGESQEQVRQSLETLTSLERTTLWYVKDRPGAAGSPSAGTAGSDGPYRRQRLAGRASTPGVSNLGAGTTFGHILSGEAQPVICGVLSDSVRAALHDVAQVREFIPCRALETLESARPVDLIVIDEQEFTRSPWSHATGPSGINAMRDLVDAVREARHGGTQTVVLHGDGVPDMNSKVIRSLPVLTVPLSPEEHAQTSGAPLSPLMYALDDIAARRRSQ